MDIFNTLQLNPKNPRTIKDEAFKKLVKKMRSFPEMLEKRPIVYDSSNNYVILGGNRRLDALRVLAKEGMSIKESYFADGASWSEEEKREFIVWDSISDRDWETRNASSRLFPPNMT